MLSSEDRHFFTIGHSDNPIEWFVQLLRINRVTAVADVRSSPHSRFNPHFNRDQLRAALTRSRIHYVPLGDELGARRKEPECYVDGTARYELIAALPVFQEGLRRLRRGSEDHRIALMCAEKDPVTCHRAILVCRHLRSFGVPISHILQTGAVETTAELEERLLRIAGNGGVDVFASDPTVAIEHAYDVQGDRIAYRKDPVAAEERG
jgi:uncharacterized protein (DUF488 family)